MVPVDVEAVNFRDGDEFTEGDVGSQFFSCHVCGDNWLSMRTTSKSGKPMLVFVHQMGMDPMLKRAGVLRFIYPEDAMVVDDWEYFIGEDAVTEESWRTELDRRRFVLRSTCMN